MKCVLAAAGRAIAVATIGDSGRKGAAVEERYPEERVAVAVPWLCGGQVVDVWYVLPLWPNAVCAPEMGR